MLDGNTNQGTVVSALNDPAVRSLLREAWQESQPGTDAAHEEGGFVLKRTDGSLTVERWPRGAQNQIALPAHTGSMRDGLRILATFHTHPNPGQEYRQEPGLTDVRGVRDDPDLGGPDYEGEYVIATEQVYLILKSGQVEVVGETAVILNAP